MPVLDLVQVFDQEVAPARGIGKQRANLRERLRIDRTAFRPRAHLSRTYRDHGLAQEADRMAGPHYRRDSTGCTPRPAAGPVHQRADRAVHDARSVAYASEAENSRITAAGIANY